MAKKQIQDNLQDNLQEDLNVNEQQGTEVTEHKVKVLTNFYDGTRQYKTGEIITIQENEFFEEILGKELIEIIEEV